MAFAPFHERHLRAGRAGLVAEIELHRERGVAKLWRDDAVRCREPQVAVGQSREVLAPAGAEEIGGPALRDEQTQDLAEGVGLLIEDQLVPGGRPAQKRVHMLEIGAVPRPQPVAEPRDFAVIGRRRERNRIQIVEHDLPALVRCIRPLRIGAQRRRVHLAELVRDRVRDAGRRVAVFLDLGRERAAARRIVVGGRRPS